VKTLSLDYIIKVVIAECLDGKKPRHKYIKKITFYSFGVSNVSSADVLRKSRKRILYLGRYLRENRE
jgi:hypothetical protein